MRAIALSPVWIAAVLAGFVILGIGDAHSKQLADPTCDPEECANERFAGATCYMGECFDEYIVKTVKLTNGILQVLVKIRDYNFSNPRVTLGLPEYGTHWVLCRSPGGYVEDEKHIRIEEPNPQSSHATEPAENLWAAVCNPKRGTR